MKFITILCCAAVILGSPENFASAATLGNRIAFTVGISSYRNFRSLPNARNDSVLIAESLRKLGFRVTQLENVDISKFALPELPPAIPGKANIVFIYYAGHGVQVLGENFILLSDASVSDGNLHGIVPLSKLLRSIGGEGYDVVLVLDACRDNPFGTTNATAEIFLRHFPDAYQFYAGVVPATDEAKRNIGLDNGLSRVDAQPQNVLMFFSTRAGAVSYDGAGPDSPFALALSKAIENPRMDLTKVFRIVRDDVVKSTGGMQEPFLYGTIGDQELRLAETPWPSAGGNLDKESADAIAKCQEEAAPSTEDFPKGRPVTGISWDQAIPACEQALDAAPNNPILHYWIGRAYMAARQDGLARDHYLVAAQSGIGPAMHNLAQLYDGGRKFEFDAVRAFYWLTKAADKGVVPSRSQLGWYYESGRAGRRDIMKAFRLYEINAEWGEAYSQMKLGYFYRLGLAVPASKEMSIHWFETGARNGDVVSMYELGSTLLSDAALSERDRGMKWMLAAVANGSDRARERMQDIYDQPDDSSDKMLLVDVVKKALGSDSKKDLDLRQRVKYLIEDVGLWNILPDLKR